MEKRKKKRRKIRIRVITNGGACIHIMYKDEKHSLFQRLFIVGVIPHYAMLFRLDFELAKYENEIII